MLRQQENDLLATEKLFLDPRLSAVKVRELITLLELSFERFDHDRLNLPILIPGNTTRNLSLLNPNVRDDLDRSIIVSKITKRRPVIVVLRPHTSGQHEQHEKGFEEQQFQLL